MIVGPKRSTLQAMLANLESEDDMPALQSGAASPPRGGNNNIQELEQTGTTYTMFHVTVIIISSDCYDNCLTHFTAKFALMHLSITKNTC